MNWGIGCIFEVNNETYVITSTYHHGSVLINTHYDIINVKTNKVFKVPAEKIDNLTIENYKGWKPPQ